MKKQYVYVGPAGVVRTLGRLLNPGDTVTDIDPELAATMIANKVLVPKEVKKDVQPGN